MGGAVEQGDEADEARCPLRSAAALLQRMDQRNRLAEIATATPAVAEHATRSTIAGVAAVICNVLVFAVTGIIVLTEGVPKKPHYLVLTLLMLLVPAQSTVVLLRKAGAHRAKSPGDDGSSAKTLGEREAVLCNAVLGGASCWAAVAQYLYAEGSGVIPFAVLVVGTPLVTLLAPWGREG